MSGRRLGRVRITPDALLSMLMHGSSWTLPDGSMCEVSEGIPATARFVSCHYDHDDHIISLTFQDDSLSHVFEGCQIPQHCIRLKKTCPEAEPDPRAERMRNLSNHCRQIGLTGTAGEGMKAWYRRKRPWNSANKIACWLCFSCANTREWTRAWDVVSPNIDQPCEECKDDYTTALRLEIGEAP